MKEKEFFQGFVLYMFLGVFTSVLLVPKWSFLNVLFHFCFVGILFFLLSIFVKKTVIPYLILSTIVLGIFFINEYVYSVRFSYIRYADFFCIGDALRVSGGYSGSLSVEAVIKSIIACVISGVGVLLVFVISPFFENRFSIWKDELGKEIRWIKKRFIMPLIFCLICLLGIVGYGVLLDNDIARYEMSSEYERNGLLLTWYNQFLRSSLNKPKGFSDEAARNALEKYSDDAVGSVVGKETVVNKKPIDIVVIMNESFADYSKIGKVKWKIDPLLGIHSRRDLKGGMVISPVYGGYTANPEFEFLTGMSTAFLPEDCVPYLNYLDHPIESIVSDVKADGFATCALHPYHSNEFKRLNIYNKVFEFDKAVFGEDYLKEAGDMKSGGEFGDGYDYVRGFISDRECYKSILSELGQDDNHFVFNVTMHNHGGYTSANLIENSIRYTGDDAWDDYLNGLSRSDKDFIWFIDQLETMENEVIVLFFGDHQPALGQLDSYVDVEEQYKGKGIEPYKYIVPYYIWTNMKDVELEAPKVLSPQYLSVFLKKNAGIALNDWDRLRLELYKELPVLSPLICMEKDGEFKPTINVNNTEVFRDYELIQYDRLFD